MASPMPSPANSPPGTPSRARSMSPILTPRSKVAAMLAGMDSGSESSGGEDIDVLMKKATRPPPGIEEKVDKNNQDGGSPLFDPNILDSPLPSLNVTSSEEEEEEEEEEEPVRPRGKLAARMMAAHQAQAAKKEGNAYGRVKASTFGGDKAEKSAPASGGSQSSDAEMQDDDVPASISRRKKISPKKFSSPKPSSTSSTPRSARAKTTPPPGPEEDSDADELPEKLIGNERFMALVAKKRAERQVKEAEEAAKEAERRKNRSKLDAQLEYDSDGEGDSGPDNLLSQRAPTRRKAGKKALEEMHKETQRMARSMQLEHQAKTRKKVTKQSLFDKFNFRSSGVAIEKLNEGDISVGAGSESGQPAALTPSSPPGSETRKVTEDTTMEDAELPMPASRSEVMDLDGEIAPKLDKGKGKEVATTSSPHADKGKGKAIEEGKAKATPTKSPKTKLTLPPVRVVLPHRLLRPSADDSDSDLEILPDQSAAAPGVQAFLERQKMIESLRQVRRASPPRARKAGQLTAKELRAELLRKGRQQAAQEREEHIQELKAKGVIVLTAEERAKEKAEVENLLEKARQQALAVKRAEKKKEKQEGGVKKEGCEDEDDEDDEDWLEEEDAGSAIELSGSEEEQEGEEGEGEDGDEEEEEGDEKPTVNDFSDEEKNGSDLDDGTHTPVFSLSSMRPHTTPRLSEIPAAYIDDEASDDSDSGEFAPLKKKKSQQKKQQRKKMRVVLDDEDEEIETKKAPESKIPSIFQKSEAQPVVMGMSMTQLFASTIGNPPGGVQVEASQNIPGKVEALRCDPGEGLPNSQALNFDDESQDKTQPESSRLKLDYSQSQVCPAEPESLPKVVLQYGSDGGEDMPDPTQDQGFEMSSNPAPPRFTPEPEEEPPSTISTQMLDSQFGVGKKRGRLVRKETDFSDEEEEKVADSAAEEDEEDVADIAENVFQLMKKASKKKTKKPKEPDNFDKSKSEAKGMVYEQAEESEDEYAGIGGASDDEADKDGHDSEMEDMVDDTNAENVDEDAMAAYYAEREKLQDEKDVNKLLKDLQSGLLRKKRGAEFDLDDSDEDDDGEARRRAAKRRQMAKMRKELMKDANIERIASNPKRLAFLAAIEDRDRDEEMDFLDRGEEDLFIELGMVSQSEVSQSQQCEGSEEASPAPTGVEGSNEEGREGSKDASREGSKETTPLPVPQSRRPVKAKVSSLVHVREQLSFLIEEKESQIDFSDDDEAEEESAVIRQKRVGLVIDRVAVKRSASAISESTRMAFQTSGSSPFKVPTLLRRATASSTLSVGSDSQSSNASGGTERSLGQQGDVAGVKRGGKASSSINFHAREQVRSKVAVERESKKKIERKKEGMKRQSVLGVLAKGGFS